MTDVAGEPVEVIFTPHLIPMDRGIFTTIYADAAPAFTDAQLSICTAPIMPRPRSCASWDTCPQPRTLRNTNFVDITVRVVRGRIVVLVCEDNLVRGASGVAVQNFNRMIGWDEKLALF